MSRNMFLSIGLILILLIGGVFFLNSSKNSTTAPAVVEPTAQSHEQSSSPEGMIMDASRSGETGSENVKEFTVIGSNFKFEPAVLTVNKGDKVKITFKSTNGNHNFVIDDLDVASKTIKTGEETTVEFSADNAGSFEYYCSIGNHRQMGMKGTLVVK